jgi:lipid-A-disaccharide synthase
MRRVAARVLVIFPFETQIYQDAGIDVTFVGHPLVELVTTPEPRERFLSSLGLDPAAPTVALLPGSRPNEVHRILPPLAAAATMIRTAVPRVQFVVARAPQLPDALFGPLASISPRPAIVPDHTDNVLAAADVVVTASGTATVQTAIHERPMVIVYRLSPLTYKIGKPFVNVDTYGMANLVAGTKVVPELIQDDLTPEAVARETISLLTDPERARRMRADLATVRRRLGDPGASRRAAEEVLKVARHAKIRLTP